MKIFARNGKAVTKDGKAIKAIESSSIDYNELQNKPTKLSDFDNDREFITSDDAVETYVAKESGKGLSSNDYTTAEKNKLSGIEAGAQKNPTAVSQLENDAQYTTKTYVDDLFNSLTHAEDYEY